MGGGGVLDLSTMSRLMTHLISQPRTMAAIIHMSCNAFTPPMVTRDPGQGKVSQLGRDLVRGEDP